MLWCHRNWKSWEVRERVPSRNKVAIRVTSRLSSKTSTKKKTKKRCLGLHWHERPLRRKRKERRWLRRSRTTRAPPSNNSSTPTPNVSCSYPRLPQEEHFFVFLEIKWKLSSLEPLGSNDQSRRPKHSSLPTPSLWCDSETPEASVPGLVWQGALWGWEEKAANCEAPFAELRQEILTCAREQVQPYWPQVPLHEVWDYSKGRPVRALRSVRTAASIRPWYFFGSEVRSDVQQLPLQK